MNSIVDLAELWYALCDCLFHLLLLSNVTFYCDRSEKGVFGVGFTRFESSFGGGEVDISQKSTFEKAIISCWSYFNYEYSFNYKKFNLVRLNWQNFRNFKGLNSLT